MTDIPIPPKSLLWQVSATADESEFFQSADSMTGSLLEALRTSKVPLVDDARVLDFGCGVGKVLIGLHLKRPGLRLHGCDVDHDVITWCRANLDFAECYRNSLTPPLHYEAASFDVINAVSVFTHLSLKQQFQWAWELFRVLKPGGALHFTTHGLAYFGLFSYLVTRRPLTRFSLICLGGNAMLLDLEQTVLEEHYVKGREGEQAQGQLEVAVAHTREAVEAIFAPFAMPYHCEEGPIGSGHDAYVLIKPPDSADAICMEIEKFQEPRQHKVVAFDIPLSGQDTFKTFVCAPDPGVHIATLSARITGLLNGSVIFAQDVGLSRGTRFFGPYDLRPVAVSIPSGLTGSLRLEIKIIGEGNLPPLLHWLVPHAFSRPKQLGKSRLDTP
jgi:2-polyprenyl-3-methyl-5-hydroxy-6-metoxy-1,4-benzoquinol methylase